MMLNLTPIDPIEKSLFKEIINTSDYDTNLQKISIIMTEYFEVDFCLIVTNFNNIKYFYYFQDFPDNPISISQSKISGFLQSSWVQSLKNDGKVKSISDLNNKKNQGLSPYFEGLNIQALLGIATNFKGKTNGIIVLGKHQTCQWSQRNKKQLKEVADIVALACHLYQLDTIDNKNKNDNKDNVFSFSNIHQLPEENPLFRIWWESSRKQLERQLEWNRKLIYNMITIMSDQTRNPLAIMKMGITVLKTKELSPEDFIKRLEMLEKSWHQLNNINEKILQLKHLKSPEIAPNPTSINVKEFIDNIVNNYQNKWQKNKKKSLNLKTNYEISDQELIKTDVQHLNNIFGELLTNAGKFSVANSTVTLEVIRENNTNHSQIVIIVSNVSDCVLKDNINDFFEPFYREQIVIDTAIPGIGVGLNIVKDLVKLLQGKITVDCLNTENPKHCKIVFRLVLPQSLSSC
ncbi:MAG: sensor histidine kinase [Crocosphaera sp.]